LKVVDLKTVGPIKKDFNDIILCLKPVNNKITGRSMGLIEEERINILCRSIALLVSQGVGGDQ